MQREIVAAVVRGDALKQILALIVAAAVRLCGAGGAAICVLSAGDDELTVEAALGRNVPQVDERFAVRGRPSRRLLAAQDMVRSAGPQRDHRSLIRAWARRTGARSLSAMPLRAATGPAGLLVVTAAAPGRFRRQDEAVLWSLADNASVAIEMARLRAARPDLDPALPAIRLRSRERQIVTLLVLGKTHKEAAAVLGISPRTLEHYLERLKARLHQPRLRTLIAYLVERGCISTAAPAEHVPSFAELETEGE